MRLRHNIKGYNKPKFTEALDKLSIRYKTHTIGGAGQILNRICFELFIFDDDPRWQEIKNLAIEHDVRIRTSATFSSGDIASANWLLAYATADADYPQPEKNFGYKSSSFDLAHACNRCGIGKIQTGPIRLKAEPKGKRAHFFGPQWLHQIIFARHEVRAVFEAEGVSGVRYLAPVKHRTGAPLEMIVQILPTTILPEGLVTAVQEQVICSPYDDEMGSMPRYAQRGDRCGSAYCGRVKYHVPYRSRLVHYLQRALNGAPDIVLSGEWFGSGGAAAQQIIVSKKVAQLVLANKWKGLELEPIELV